MGLVGVLFSFQFSLGCGIYDSLDGLNNTINREMKKSLSRLLEIK